MINIARRTAIETDLLCASIQEAFEPKQSYTSYTIMGKFAQKNFMINGVEGF